MSKFLKFIVHFVVICTILCVVALAVPPFFGVTTEIRDDSTVKSNLAMGSVTYAISVKTEEAALGTPILVNDENAVYRYTLASADVANGTGTAMDPTVSQGQPINVAIGSYLPKIVVTIPFIGYLMAATKSIEGLIVLGLTVLFLIILYVIAELWKKDQDDYDDYPEDTEPGYVKSRKELKKEEKRKEREYRDEEREIKAQGKRSKKEKRKIRTGGFVDEIDEDDFDVEEEEAPQRAVQSATSEAHELLQLPQRTPNQSGSLLSLQHRLRRQHRRRKQLRRFMRKKRINQWRSRNWQSQDIHRRSLLRKQRKKEMLLTL